MAKTPPPWADMLPQSVYQSREDPLSYRWDHIDTEITEGEECISWCRTGLFDPIVNRVNFGVRSAGNASRILSSIQPVIFDSISHIRVYPPCELPINIDALSTSFSSRGLTSDGFNLYVADTHDSVKKIFRMLGQSGEVDTSIDFPAAYAEFPWYLRSISWYNGNICLHFNNSSTEQIEWVEMEGFSDTIDKVVSLDNFSYTEILGGLNLGCMQLDPVNGWIVGIGTGYRPSGGYRTRLVRWDYATGNRIGDITSTLYPYENGPYSYFAINYDDNLIYVYHTADDAIYTFDYTEVTTYFPLYSKYTIPFGTSYRGGDHGMWWHPDHPEDMWMSGFYNVPSGAERIWKYIFDSDIEQFCGQGDFTYFSSTAAISTDINDPAWYPGGIFSVEGNITTSITSFILPEYPPPSDDFEDSRYLTIRWVLSNTGSIDPVTSPDATWHEDDPDDDFEDGTLDTLKWNASNTGSIDPVVSVDFIP